MNIYKKLLKITEERIKELNQIYQEGRAGRDLKFFSQTFELNRRLQNEAIKALNAHNKLH